MGFRAREQLKALVDKVLDDREPVLALRLWGGDVAMVASHHPAAVRVVRVRAGRMEFW